MHQPVGGIDARAVQLVAQQAVVGVEVRGDYRVQPPVQAALEVSGQFQHRVLPPGQEVHVVGVEGGSYLAAVFHFPLLQLDEDGISPLLGGDGAAFHVGRCVVVSCRDGYFPMLPGVLVQPVDAQDEFVVVAQPQGFRDVVLHRLPLRVVEAHQPVGLVGEDGRQREDDHEGNVFRGQFHARKVTLFPHTSIHLVRLNNTCGKTW